MTRREVLVADAGLTGMGSPQGSQQRTAARDLRGLEICWRSVV
ncbi:hypothetical protein [Streptomyces phaeochromogenes]